MAERTNFRRGCPRNREGFSERSGKVLMRPATRAFDFWKPKAQADR